ncbi:single-stranded DNA-binding protein [Aeribacillus sp. FSL W8-0870]|uniref:single-stranded DNA-binding protein n=1 Tax=Aeribacillus sp. FSL W8-0870 TaxID=2954706 RepID=UPI0030D01CF3
MYARLILIGRLTRDPELRYTPSGVGVCTFTLAVDRPFTNQQGDREADFIPIVVWRQLAETCANYLRKGRLVAVEGRIQVRSYTPEGSDQRRYVTEVVAENVRFLESANSGSGNNGNGNGGQGGGGNQGSGRGGQTGGGRNQRGGRSDDHPGAGGHDPGYDPFWDDGRPIDISDDDLPF